jgi:AcrR family transcriptional regulator
MRVLAHKTYNRPVNAQRPQSRYYEAMLDEARALFAERGYHRTSIREITAQVGASGALVYRHFGSKEELFRRSVLEHAAELIDDHLADAPTPTTGEYFEVLRAEIAALHRLCTENQALLRLLIAGSFSPTAGQTDYPVRPLLDRLERVIATAVPAEHRDRFDLAIAARAGFGFVMSTSVFHDWLFDAGQPLPPAEHCVRQLTALMVYGCTGRPGEQPGPPRLSAAPAPRPEPAPDRADVPRPRVSPGHRQRRSRHQVRRLILDAAGELFVANGYDGTTTKAIADRAGVAETSVFRHFGDKPALFEHAIFEPFRRWVGDYLDHWGRTGRTHRSLELQTRDYIGSTYRMVLGNGVLLRSALSGGGLGGPTGPGSPLPEIFLRLEDQLAELAHRNNLTGIDPVLVIRPTFGMLYAVAALPEWMFGKRGARPSRAALVRELTGLMVYGTIRRPAPG